MKNTRFSDILHQLDTETLAELTQEEKMPKRVKKRISSSVLAEAGLSLPVSRPPVGRRRRVAWTVALLLLMAICFGAAVYAAERKEYGEALAFFEIHGFSPEGLTRNEVRAVYRDITTGHFTYYKTARVLEQNLTSSVSGFEFSQEPMTPEKLERLWSYYQAWMLEQGEETRKNGYFLDYGNGKDERVQKYQAGVLCWEVVLEDYAGFDLMEVEGGVLVQGQTPYNFNVGIGEVKTYPQIVKIREDGQILWKQSLDNGYNREWIDAVLENRDGNYAVFSRGDFSDFCFSLYSPEGKRLVFQATPMKEAVGQAVEISGGYLVSLRSSQIGSGDPVKILKIDPKGAVTDAFTFCEKDAFYYFTDMLEWNGSIYLSGYTVPHTEANRYGECGEIYRQIADGEYGHEIPDETLTRMMRDNYTAVLLICNPDDGLVQVFYSAGGGIGRTLSVALDGRLIWEVLDFAEVHYSPATSAYSFYGIGPVYRYSFLPGGFLLGRETSEGSVASFYR